MSDYLCELSAQPVSSLFRVFWKHGAWCVCAVTLEGVPVAVLEGHANLQLAIDQADQLNRWNTEPPAKTKTFFQHFTRWFKGRAK